MTPYVVIPYESNKLQEVLFHDIAGNRRIFLSHVRRDNTSLNPDFLFPLAASEPIRFARDREVAERLAEALAAENPGVAFVVLETKFVYKASPGPVSVAEMTPKGLLPK